MKEAPIPSENDELVKVVRTELEEEIEKLFYVVDINQNGWLDQKELHDALVSVGINPAPDDIVEYFRSFDKVIHSIIEEQRWKNIYDRIWDCI